MGLLVFVFSTTVAYGATYYVRTDGNNSNTGTSNTAGEAWLTIGTCASTIVAGDVCRVQTGTYAEVVAESTSGASGNTVTYVADGSVTNHGWVITGDYVRIIGFIVEGGHTRLDGIYIRNADYVEVWHNTLQNFERDTIRTDSGGSQYQSNNCLFIGNVTRNSRLKDFQVRGHSNLIAYNEAVTPETDFIYLFGQRNRVLNNYSHGVNAAAASHTDFIQSGGGTLGMGNTLIEGNRYDDANSPGTVTHHHGSNVQNNVAPESNTVLRRNLWSNHGSYTYGFSGSNFTYLKIYNETAVNAMIDPYSDDNSYGFFNRGHYPSYKNNIFVQQWGVYATTVSVWDATQTGHASDYNLYFDTGGNINYSSTINNEGHSLINTDPLLTNRSALDFTLQAESPTRGNGGPLTTVTSASGTGTTFTVADATYFRGDDTTIAQYGGNLVVGDTITVGTDVVTIVSISGNSVTATPSISWANGDPVYFGSDTTPDIGALPHMAGGHTLTAGYSVSGGVATVIPSDANLVRFVVCYQNGIPTAVANSAPYTCPAGQGTFSARAYPLYASKILVVNAVPGAPPPNTPAAPTNLRIVQ